jgi:hypothetical protein
MKKGLLAAIVGIILAAGVGFYVLNLRSSAPSGTNTATQDSGDSSMQKSSLRALMGSGKNQSCTYTDESGNSGTMYLSGSKVRSDFESTVNGTVTASHMFSDGTSMYIWSDGTEGGMMMKLDAAAQTQPGSEQQKSVDVDKQLDYSCAPWVADPALLTYPQDLEFTDFSAMMQPTGVTIDKDTPVSLDKESQCASCDSLNEEAAAQCRQALGC